jgi:HEAT repeat protein
MKRSLKYTTILTVVLLILGIITVNAQNSVPVTLNEIHIQNLITGIQSPNEGLKKSSIYLAGKYKVSEVTGILCKQLDGEKNPDTRILIALSLYQINDPAGLEAVKKLSVKDKDSKVRRMSTAIYQAYKENGYTASYNTGSF